MKIQNLKILMIAAGAAILLTLSGCTKENGFKADEPTDNGSVFDFSTRETYTLNLNYDVPEGYKVYFEVYTSDPEQVNADGQVVKRDLDPIDAGFTDGQGNYSHKISVPSAVKFLYIYSPYAGVPRVMAAKIESGVLSDFKYPNEIDGARSSLLVRAGGDNQDEVYNKLDGLKRLGYWTNSKGIYLLNNKYYDLYGRPDYVKTEKLTISKDILNLINQTVPEGGGVDQQLVKNGDIHVTEKAHVDIYLIDEETSANSTLAYYCYKTGNAPKSEAEIKDIVVVFPNAKVLKNHGYNPAGNNGALERGEGVRLHYWENGVDMGDEFPENTSIGWVIYNQSYLPCVSGTKKMNENAPHFFADKNLNRNGKGHVVLFKSGEKVIFGFEDWPGDYDYNDVVFYAKADPVQAITPEIPEVTPEEPDDTEIVVNVIYRGILTFEDIWPYRGDFDMNDVVIGYKSTVGYNQKNEVIQTTDEYTVLSSGAKINNSFAYQLDVRRSEIEVDIKSSLGGNGGAYVDQALDKATIRLANNVLDYANNNKKETFTVVTKYTERRISKDDFTKPPYNPFITTSGSSVEVHLTNMRPTEKLNKDNLGYGHDKSNPGANLYYITYDETGQQMPFAIDIAFENDSDLKAFVIPKEQVRIDKYYPKFLNWVQTNGKEDADWYLHSKVN